MEVVIDPRLPLSQGMLASEIVKSTVRLVSPGKSDFEAIEPSRNVRFFQRGPAALEDPGQRGDAAAPGCHGGCYLRALTDESSLQAGRAHRGADHPRTRAPAVRTLIPL
jgi:hypothetical protein